MDKICTHAHIITLNSKLILRGNCHGYKYLLVNGGAKHGKSRALKRNQIKNIYQKFKSDILKVSNFVLFEKDN